MSDDHTTHADAALAASGGASSAVAADYPTRPIRMIAPFTPGSPVDVVARLLAQHLTIQLKQSVVVENRPGAGTTIGMKAASLAEPDGYTLLFQSSSLLVAPAMYKNLDYDPLKSFTPVANVAWGSWVTVVPPQLAVHSPQELIAHAKARPGTLNFGFGQGTAPQLVGEWFNKTNGLQIASVPYKGGMQAITDMLGGTIHVNIGTSSTLLPLIREGKIRAIAWGSRNGATPRGRSAGQGGRRPDLGGGRVRARPKTPYSQVWFGRPKRGETGAAVRPRRP